MWLKILFILWESVRMFCSLVVSVLKLYVVFSLYSVLIFCVIFVVLSFWISIIVMRYFSVVRLWYRNVFKVCLLSMIMVIWFIFYFLIDLNFKIDFGAISSGIGFVIWIVFGNFVSFKLSKCRVIWFSSWRLFFVMLLIVVIG